jgi:hypothetical protein
MERPQRDIHHMRPLRRADFGANMSRADDGARPVLVGGAGEDSGITTHGVTRASMLRPGQKLKHWKDWYTLLTVEIVDGIVTAKSDHVTWWHPAAEMVKVRDILHTYTDAESATA